MDLRQVQQLQTSVSLGAPYLCEKGFKKQQKFWTLSAVFPGFLGKSERVAPWRSQKNLIHLPRDQGQRELRRIRASGNSTQWILWIFAVVMSFPIIRHFGWSQTNSWALQIFHPQKQKSPFEEWRLFICESDTRLILEAAMNSSSPKSSSIFSASQDNARADQSAAYPMPSVNMHWNLLIWTAFMHTYF